MVDAEVDSSPQSKNPFYPFASQRDWEVAYWFVREDPGHKAFDRFLHIPGVRESLGLSYETVRAMLELIESVPERAGQWYLKRLSFQDRPDQKFTIRHRNILDAIRSLWGDPALAKYLVYKPRHVFADATKQKRIYSEMCTGNWWHAIQSRLPAGATLAPVILATDKTQLTQFSGGKSAYPIYLTLGNLPKAVRRKSSLHPCVLLGYLSVDKVARDSLTHRELTARNQRLFHESMRIILEPLREAGLNGVRMTGGDGAVHLVFPILAAYVADYPEQCLVTCTKYGTCPKCRAPAKDLQNPSPGEARTQAWTTGVIDHARTSSPSVPQFYKACMDQEVSGSVYRPFWDGLPHTDIHPAITPDNGISALSQISGSERKNMAKILLGCLIGRVPRQALLSYHAILDFIYLAQYSTHDDDTLGYLQDALRQFHTNRAYFIRAGIREDLNIPKFHSLLHYLDSIKMLGTTDNYNMEMFERLHIDFAKAGWRASNQRNEFPQMINWLSRQEKMWQFESYISSLDPSIARHRPPTRRPCLPKRPSHPNKHIIHIEFQHNASGFSRALKEYLNIFLAPRTSNRIAALHSLPFNALDVYHQLKFNPEALEDDEEENDVVPTLPE
ncbi:hypothetical protein LXA43DRAFT_976630 [Ganoderma leucocontextum]|nr:hypothetical protein LXA43DRAFT_976630 [Ganoderma leucocontextum]